MRAQQICAVANPFWDVVWRDRLIVYIVLYFRILFNIKSKSSDTTDAMVAHNLNELWYSMSYDRQRLPVHSSVSGYIGCSSSSIVRNLCPSSRRLRELLPHTSSPLAITIQYTWHDRASPIPPLPTSYDTRFPEKANRRGERLLKMCCKQINRARYVYRQRHYWYKDMRNLPLTPR